jgi:hypothetical protein
MRFLPQIRLRSLRKLDCYANRHPRSPSSGAHSRDPLARKRYSRQHPRPDTTEIADHWHPVGNVSHVLLDAVHKSTRQIRGTRRSSLLRHAVAWMPRGSFVDGRQDCPRDTRYRGIEIFTTKSFRRKSRGRPPRGCRQDSRNRETQGAGSFSSQRVAQMRPMTGSRGYRFA